MNPENPGRPIDANAVAQNNPPRIGTDFHRPPNDPMSKVCRRS